MDYIHINNLVVKGKHGAYSEERKVEQEFEFSLTLAVGNTSHAARSHKLKDAVDYQPIKEMIEKTVRNNSFYLIETLAEVIAESILLDKRIKHLELTVKKPEVWESGVPGLTITRSN